MFEKEWLPNALSMGVSYNDFWHMNPHIINLIAEGHNKRLHEIDNLVWQWVGLYGVSALNAVIGSSFGKRKIDYTQKSLFQIIEEEELKKKQDRKEYEGMTKEEKQEAEWEKAKSYFDMLAIRFSQKEKKEGEDKP